MHGQSWQALGFVNGAKDFGQALPASQILDAENNTDEHHSHVNGAMPQKPTNWHEWVTHLYIHALPLPSLQALDWQVILASHEERLMPKRGLRKRLVQAPASIYNARK